MKFRYYITDMVVGQVVGTDFDDVAKEFAESEDCFVVDSDTGVWLLGGDKTEDIPAADAEDADMP